MIDINVFLKDVLAQNLMKLAGIEGTENRK